MQAQGTETVVSKSRLLIDLINQIIWNIYLKLSVYNNLFSDYNCYLSVYRKLFFSSKMGKCASPAITKAGILQFQLTLWPMIREAGNCSNQTFFLYFFPPCCRSKSKHMASYCKGIHSHILNYQFASGLSEPWH